MAWISTGHVLAPGIRSVEVSETVFGGNALVIVIKIPLRPAQVVRCMTQILLQRLAGGIQVGTDSFDFLFAARTGEIPACVRVCMTVNLECAGLNHGVDFAPAQHDFIPM